MDLETKIAELEKRILRMEDRARAEDLALQDSAEAMIRCADYARIAEPARF